MSQHLQVHCQWLLNQLTRRASLRESVCMRCVHVACDLSGPFKEKLCDPRLLICYPLSQQKTSLEFYIDIHAHSTMMNGFMYGNIFEDEERFQRQAIFPKLLCQNAEDFSYVRQGLPFGLARLPSQPCACPSPSLCPRLCLLTQFSLVEHLRNTSSVPGLTWMIKTEVTSYAMLTSCSLPVRRETLKWQ